MSQSARSGIGQTVPDDLNLTISSPSKRNRQATVYDAVAGRVSTQRFIPDTPYTSSIRDTATSSALPTPPDEVLFRRVGAPERYDEDDIYWSDRHLDRDKVLPESDLVKAAHTYASDYYHKALGVQGHVSFESMDETALLALGILLEEAAEHVLGDTGDMVFVEGDEISASEHEPDIEDLELEDDLPKNEEVESSGASSSDKGRSRKKRKIQHRNEWSNSTEEPEELEESDHYEDSGVS